MGTPLAPRMWLDEGAPEESEVTPAPPVGEEGVEAEPTPRDEEMVGMLAAFEVWVGEVDSSWMDRDVVLPTFNVFVNLLTFSTCCACDCHLCLV